ncbi:MAG: hypothetical protein JNM68_02595 [Dinghuibacter sp.]|nr:hypothetical protein [Dinghuibacter sp.]
MQLRNQAQRIRLFISISPSNEQKISACLPKARRQVPIQMPNKFKEASPTAVREQIRENPRLRGPVGQAQPSAAHPPVKGISPSNEQKISACLPKARRQVPIQKPNKFKEASPTAVREQIRVHQQPSTAHPSRHRLLTNQRKKIPAFAGRQARSHTNRLKNNSLRFFLPFWVKWIPLRRQKRGGSA